MSDKEIVDLVAQMYVNACGSQGDLCTCGAVTDIWEELLPDIEQRARELKLTKYGRPKP